MSVYPDLSIVVPCFNEQDCLDELYRRISAACIDAVGDGYEMVLVNDGSSDLTWPKMQRLAAQDPHIVAINLSRNHGHQLALTAGLTMARGKRILIIDADLQDPPELLKPMIAKMDEGYDVVYGQRGQRQSETPFKKLSAFFFYRFLERLSDTAIPVDAGDFRLITRRALDALLAMPEQHRFVRGMVSWIGFPQTPFSYDRDERYAGSTKYPLRKMIHFAFDAITGYSIAPLRFASQVGILLAILGVVLTAYILIAWVSGDTVQGWTSLMAAVVVLGSIQMFVLGLLGEYVGRLYMQAKQRPLFIIQDIASQTPVEADCAQRLGHVASASPTEQPQDLRLLSDRQRSA